MAKIFKEFDFNWKLSLSNAPKTEDIHISFNNYN